jgi:lysophospholipase L1-like esterase
MCRMLRKLLLGVAATALTLGMLEAVIRLGRWQVHDLVHESHKYLSLLVLDDAGGYLRHPASTQLFLQGVPMRFNSLGMRDDEPRIPRPRGVFRVLCLGDSMVFGPWVAQEATYPARLRALLAGEPVDVVAAGVQGWNTEEEERFLAANIARLAPDLVVLLYVVNDNEPTNPLARARLPARTWAARLHRALLVRSRLFEWAAFVYRSRVAPLDRGAVREVAWLQRQREAAGASFAPDDPGWLRSRAALGRIDALARAHGARLAVFLHNLGNLPPAPAALERLREFGAAGGVPVFDTAPFFAGRPWAALINDRAPAFDFHPNAEGYGLLAEGIGRTLRAQGLLPRRASAVAVPPLAVAGAGGWRAAGGTG